MAASSTNGANLGFESERWKAADALRSNTDAAEYKHVVLGLIFLKYISDAIADTYHAWRGDRLSPSPSGRGRGEGPKYADIAGFCKSASLDDIRQHGHILTPGRYVGAAEVEDDGEPFEAKMARLTAELREQTNASAKLDKLIWANLEDIGCGA